MAFGKFLIFRFHNYRFKELFGYYTQKNKLYLIVPLLKQINNEEFPYKPEGRDDIKVSAKKVLPISDVISLNYFLKFIPIFIKDNYSITTDLDQNVVGHSFISFGGVSSLTMTILSDPKNKFYQFQGSSIIKKDDQSRFTAGEYDYCMIIKIKKNENIWIAIAGLGELGTRGGAWFFAKKWKEIQKKVGDKDFGLLLRATPDRDDSAELIDLIF